MTIMSKHFIKNSFYNIIGFGLITGFIQIIIYPFLSRIMSQADYGLAITLIGFTNLFAAVFANSLKTLRLRLQHDYTSKNLQGDFKWLFFLSILLNAVMVAVLVLIYEPAIMPFDLCLLIIMSIFAHTRIYCVIYYALKLEFKKLAMMSIVVVTGYLIGIVIARTVGIWQFAFIVGEFFGCIFLFLTTDLVSEKLSFTPQFKITFTIYLSLIGLQVLMNIPVYADRLFIYPVLGGEAVTIYYVAVFFGRTIGVITTPMGEVIASYYAKKHSLTLKEFWKVNALVIVLGFIIVAITYFIAAPFTGILYPDLVIEAQSVMFLANIGMIIFFLSLLILPAAMRFFPIYLQVINQTLTVLCYIGTSLYFSRILGVLGFCYAMLITYSLNFILLLLFGSLYLIYSKKKHIDCVPLES